MEIGDDTEIDSTSPEPVSMEKTISDALQSIPTFKQNLRIALEALQCYSSSLSPSMNLVWSDFDSHYSSLQTSLETHFKQLQSKPPPPQQSKDWEPNIPRDLQSICRKMDGIGLRCYLKHHNPRAILQAEITQALRSAPDPPQLLLHCMQGFTPESIRRKSSGFNKTCLLLLKSVFDLTLVVKPETKENAKKLLAEWKGKVRIEVYLRFVALYGLKDDFNVDKVFDMLEHVPEIEQTVELCKRLGCVGGVPDLIKKLNHKKKQLLAVRLAYAFELVDMFPPVLFIETYLKESKKALEETLDNKDNSPKKQHVAILMRIKELKAVIKCIEECKLESHFPRVILEEQLKELNKQKLSKLREQLKELKKHKLAKRRSLYSAGLQSMDNIP